MDPDLNLSWCAYYVTLAATILLVSVVFLRFRKNRQYNLPPGPKGWPIVGNMFQLKQPVYKTLHLLAQKHGPVMSMKLGSINTVVLSSSEKAKEFFKSSVDIDFANRPPTAFGELVFYQARDMMFSPYGQHWRECRKICSLNLLSSKRVQSFAAVRREEVDMMAQQMWIDSKAGTLPVNISHAVATVSSNVIWRSICGRKFVSNHEIGGGFTFKKLIDQNSELGGEFNLGDFIPFVDWMDLQGLKRRMKRVHHVFDDFVENLIQEHLSNRITQQDKVGDFLDSLLEEGLDMTLIKGLLLDMSGGASETTATTMEWAMSLLLKHPEILRNVREEIDEIVGIDERVEEKHVEKLKYLQCVLKESMRLYPVAPLALPHYSMKDTKMFGYDIPKGSMLFINLWAIARGGAVWNDPEEFMPGRFVNEENVDLSGHSDMKSIPFSAGRRVCPGIAMAIPLMLLVLATLAHDFEWKVDGEIDMTSKAVGVTIPRKIPLMAYPHKQRGQSMPL